jgi:polyisoprenoid-binding protein YceI
VRGASAALIVALALVPACERKPKRVLRTEPWPAPLVASARPGPSASAPGGRVRYRIERAKVRVELPARRAKPSGALTEVTGSIELDPVRLENTRAHLQADLLSLSLDGENGDTDSGLVARALTWLELSSEREADARERERYATLEITAFEPVALPSDAEARRSSQVVAHGELTLHRFRVPVSLELQVELGGRDGGATDTLTIRTRRPLIVSLAAHDILPRDSRGNVLTQELATLGRDVGRDARISAELFARVEGSDKP